MTDETPVEPVATAYNNEDLVYVDPDTRTVVGKVEFNASGNPKPLAMNMPVKEEDEEGEKPEKGKPKRKPRQRYYPWGTYRSMKRVYKIEGKQHDVESQKTLDEVLEKALKEPFWD